MHIYKKDDNNSVKNLKSVSFLNNCSKSLWICYA